MHIFIPPINRNNEIGGVNLKEHYNIYYIFLEDKEKHPLPEVKDKEIKDNIKEIYKNINLPWDFKPP